jgi:hypothetical protein
MDYKVWFTRVEEHESQVNFTNDASRACHVREGGVICTDQVVLKGSIRQKLIDKMILLGWEGLGAQLR